MYLDPAANIICNKSPSFHIYLTIPTTRFYFHNQGPGPVHEPFVSLLFPHYIYQIVDFREWVVSAYKFNLLEILAWAQNQDSGREKYFGRDFASIKRLNPDGAKDISFLQTTECCIYASL